MPNVDELLAKKLDACFIHAATSAHYALAKRCLEENVAVFIDKPVSENYEEVKHLMALAEEKSCFLWWALIDDLRRWWNSYMVWQINERFD